MLFMVKAPSLRASPAHEAVDTCRTPPRPLGGLIAVVGCDGAGKSTLAADLLAGLREKFRTEQLYLGQDSGNILRWILGIPVIGSAVGRYLVVRSEHAHARDGRTSRTDIPTALVVHLLSRWRYHKFRRMQELLRRGTVVVTDRYPQAEVQGFHFDGPGLDSVALDRGILGWLSSSERLLYERMAAHTPALLIRLNVDAETAYARKPDHKLATLREKVRVIPTLKFNDAHIVDLDAREPYSKVLQSALAEAYAAVALRPEALRPAAS